MEFNNKKLERTSRWVNYLIAGILCIFLIALSHKFIDDIANWKESPRIEDFRNHGVIDQKFAEIDSIQLKIDPLREEKQNLEKTIGIAEANYRNARESFDNWLAARETIGSPDEDKEVISRAEKLDKFYETEQAWRAKLLQIEEKIETYQVEIETAQNAIDSEENQASTKRFAAQKKHNLNVFLIRLLIILPVLLLGIFFIFRFRKHKYWPLFLGFVLFSIYAFFFGLVPYLPSYGGYIRYSVGIVLCILLGGYAINKIRAFIQRKKEELKVSTTERAKNVETETAEKALDNHMCPSCGKDFIIKKWDKTVSTKKEPGKYGFVSDYCRFCGLELFKKCGNCNSDNFAHLPYCSTCGDPVNPATPELNK